MRQVIARLKRLFPAAADPERSRPAPGDLMPDDPAPGDPAAAASRPAMARSLPGLVDKMALIDRFRRLNFIDRMAPRRRGWKPGTATQEAIADLTEPSLRRKGGREYWKLHRHSPGRIGRKLFPRRPARSRLRGRLRGYLTVAALCAMVAFVPTWAMRAAGLGNPLDSAWAGLLALTGSLGLSVREIIVVGRGRTGVAEIMTALGAGRGTPILTVSPAAARDRLEALPWIGRAVVERRLPDALYVELEERQPLALWQSDGDYKLVDAIGDVIAIPEIVAFRHLPLVVGTGAAEHAPGLLAMMQQRPDLAARVTAAIRVGNRRWNLQIDGSIDVRLPERGAREAWERLADLDAEKALLERAIAEVDMRVPDRLILRPNTDDAPAVPDPKPAQQALQPQ